MNECCTRGYVHKLSLNLPGAALVNHSASATAVVLEWYITNETGSCHSNQVLSSDKKWAVHPHLSQYLKWYQK